MRPLEETEAVLRSLRGVWDEEAVDELDHALQAAACAMADDADDELVLAAALHDVAHSPLLGASSPHDEEARRWLRPRFGDRVAWLAGAHVAAKQYLVAIEPGYATGLSDTSVCSLAAQGGAHVHEGFTGHAWWPDAVRLRRYDDAAKDPEAPGATIADVLAVARRVLESSSTEQADR